MNFQKKIIWLKLMTKYLTHNIIFPSEFSQIIISIQYENNMFLNEYWVRVIDTILQLMFDKYLK